MVMMMTSRDSGQAAGAAGLYQCTLLACGRYRYLLRACQALQLSCQQTVGANRVLYRCLALMPGAHCTIADAVVVVSCCCLGCRWKL